MKQREIDFRNETPVALRRRCGDSLGGWRFLRGLEARWTVSNFVSSCSAHAQTDHFRWGRRLSGALPRWEVRRLCDRQGGTGAKADVTGSKRRLCHCNLKGLYNSVSEMVARRLCAAGAPRRTSGESLFQHGAARETVPPACGWLGQRFPAVPKGPQMPLGQSEDPFLHGDRTQQQLASINLTAAKLVPEPE